MLLWTTCVTRVVYFVDVRLDEDIHRLAVTCERVLSALSTQSIHQKAFENVIPLLEKCIEFILQWKLLLTYTRLELISQRTDPIQILDFVFQLLSIQKIKELNLEALLSQIRSRLVQKGIFQKLNFVIQGIIGEGQESIQGSVLEHLIISVLDLETQFGPDLTLASKTGAFELWCIPNLSKFSPALFQQHFNLLKLSLPYFMEIKEAKIGPSLDPRPTIKQGDYHAFLNLLELGFVQFPKTSEGALLCSGIAQYLDWVIELHRIPFLKDHASLGISEHEFELLENFRPCVEQLLDSKTGQRFLMALTEGLLPDSRLSIYYPSAELQDGDFAFFKVLNFALSASVNDELSEIICRFAINGRIIGFLWFVSIKPIWENTFNPKNHQPSFKDIEILIPALTVLSEIYSFALMLSDRDQMEHSNFPLPLTEVYNSLEPHLSLIYILKICFWQSVRPPLSTRTSSPIDRNLGGFLSKSGKLIRQLNELCIMWELAPAEAFHIEDPSISLYVTEVTTMVSSGKEVDQMTDQMTPILLNAPCLIPFFDRARIFQSQLDFSRFRRSNLRFTNESPVFKIRRSHFWQDAFEALGDLRGDELRRKLRVQFIDNHGLLEAGVDGGGLFKDFMEELSKTAFDPTHGLFAATEQGEIYPNPAASFFQSNAVQILSFLGRIAGKAVYEGILLELPFARFFLKKFCRQLCDLNDLPSLDPTVYQNLKHLKACGSTVEDLGLSFIITDNMYNTNEEVELKPGGREIPVTAANVVEYIHRFADYRLNRQGRLECNAFLTGFFDVLDPDWLRMFNASELQLLISGSLQPFDVDNLRSSVVYGGGYDENHPVIEHFWQVMQSLTVEQQRQFLRFVTGCSTAPLLGFEHLHPKICIRMSGLDDPPDLERLPTSATCANLLKLPAYPSLELLRDKLIYAISSKSGFDLS